MATLNLVFRSWKPIFLDCYNIMAGECERFRVAACETIEFSICERRSANNLGMVMA
jgi:hypothetical protein